MVPTRCGLRDTCRYFDVPSPLVRVRAHIAGLRLLGLRCSARSSRQVDRREMFRCRRLGHTLPRKTRIVDTDSRKCTVFKKGKRGTNYIALVSIERKL